MNSKFRGLNLLQKVSMTFMAFMVLLTFVGANLHALLWQSSEWLVSTVLPAVVVELTNEERTSNSEPLLQRNSTLDQAAKLKAKHMASNEYFSHFSPDGVSPWHWFDEAGYVYAHAGENLAIHFTDSSEVVDAWMDSPTHRENIVNGIYTEIGVGTAKGKFDGYDTVYVVQLFGTPAVPPVKVDNTEPLAVYDTAETTPDADLSKSKEQVVINTNDEAILITENTELDNSSVVAEESSETVLILETDNQNQQTSVGPETNTESVAIDDSEQRRNTESLLIDDNLKVSTNENNIVVRSPVIATSSGLAIAQIDTKINSSHAGGTLASIATQPNAVLQFIYTLLALAVVMMLGTSIVIEAKRFNYSQVAYGFLLLFGMGGLWFMHSLLTTGAVVT
jgi:hypothetical protein